MNQEIVRADKKFKKQFIVFLALIIIVFVVLFILLKNYLDQTVQQSRESPDLLFRNVIYLLKWWTAVGAVPILGFWVYQLLLARRIWMSGQYPPPGVKVIRDTKIQTGVKAKRRAVSIIVLSSLIFAMTLLLIYSPYILEKRLSKERTIYLKEIAPVMEKQKPSGKEVR